MAKKTKRGKGKAKSRRIALKLGIALVFVLAVWGAVSVWFVHHPRQWLREQRANMPSVVADPLFWMGGPLSDLTDALGLTGHDAVYEYDTDAPAGQVLFAGAPKRVSAPAPDDIRILDRGEFVIGWSDRLRHPVWCAYHVTKDSKHVADKRPGFTKDRSLAAAPSPNDYTRSGYDRGHMVPNYAIVTRYGEVEQKKTFMMSNIAPQAPALNRGVWRVFEHRIAELWTARYGEIWVVVGCISGGGETISGTNIDVPAQYYQIVIAQQGMDVRAVAILIDHQCSWREWAAQNIVTIDELEELTGLDFNPEMPAFIQDPLEADRPSRLWPIRTLDILRMISIHFM